MGKCHGGSIYNVAGNTLTFNNCLFKSNSVKEYDGGAVWSNRKVIIENSCFDSNNAHLCGGAVKCAKGVDLFNCLFVSNTAKGKNLALSIGGAIYAYGAVDVGNCTFKDNRAGDFGGAIYSRDDITINYDLYDNPDFTSFFINNVAENRDGGALYSENGYINIKDTLFSKNRAYVSGGAIFNSDFGKVELFHCMFNSNVAEGAKSSRCKGGAIYSERTVYVDNCTFRDNYAADDSGAIYTNDEVYINDRLDDSGGYDSFFIHNIANKYNGGAIYASSCVSAYNVLFSKNEAHDNGGAIYSKNNVYGYFCLFESNVAQGAITEKCKGGALYSSGVVTLQNCTYRDNYAADCGGAIFADIVYIDDEIGSSDLSSFFIHNIANKHDGGAVYAMSYIEICNSQFSRNEAYEKGGALYSLNREIYVTNCMFDYNSAQGAKSVKCKGGAIFSARSVYVDNSTFKYNYVADNGGAIYSECDIIINDNTNSTSSFIGNKAKSYNGGAAYAEGYIKMSNSMFSNNEAYESGGAAYSKKTVEVIHCLFDSNVAQGAKVVTCKGGAICAAGIVTVDNSTFKNNYVADSGGAIYSDSDVIIKDHGSYTTFFIGNKANKHDGGAIYLNNKCHITFSGCVFKQNTCGGKGGAIYLDSRSSHLTLVNNVFLDNWANSEGHTVFNKGYYDDIRKNYWGGSCSGGSDLIEWKFGFWVKNVHHYDKDSLYYVDLKI